MDYIAASKEILNKDDENHQLMVNLADLLIPKLMHIDTKDVSEISSIINEQTSIFNDSSIYPLPLIIQSLLDYKMSNYQESISIIANYLENPLMDFGDELRAASYTAIAINYRSIGERDAALKYFQQALELYPEKIDRSYLMYLYSISLYHIAEIYGELNEYSEMLKKHELFYDVIKQQTYPDLENRALNGLGRAYIGLNLYDIALSYLQSADENAKQSANIPFVARNLHDLGFIFDLLGDSQQSLYHYQKSLDIRIEGNYKNAAITTKIAISKVLIKQKQFIEAIDILEKAEKVATEINVKRKLGEILNNLSIAHEQNGDFKKALAYHKAFHQVKVELDNVDKTLLETQKVRETNTQLKQQKRLIEAQKQQIEIALDKLKVTNTYLENFAAVAAHDLKAPIRIASSFAKIIEKKYNNQWDKSDAEYFSYITTNISKLGQMIDDLLALSKLDQDLLPPKKIKVNKILNDVEKRLYEKIKGSNTTLIYNQDIPQLMVHPSLITQLFQNIIDNALKYRSKESPKVIVSTSVKNDYCQFEIKDNGLGIGEKEQESIFELFSGTNRKDSSGIGLATCKKIVTHYGGSIWIKSILTEGTSVFFTLPIAK